MYVILSAVILNFTDPEKFHVKACFAAFLHKLQVHVTPHPHPIHTHTGTAKFVISRFTCRQLMSDLDL